MKYEPRELENTEKVVRNKDKSIKSDEQFAIDFL